MFTEERKKFVPAVLAVFVTILIYEFLTPMLSDDLNYGIQVREAASFGDLFRQEAAQYMGWTGRSVAHILLRIFLYTGSKGVFNVCAALAFTAMTLFMYGLTTRKKTYDIPVYLLMALVVWLFGVSFSETVLWETGACNYLFTTAIITGYLWFMKRNMDKTFGIAALAGIFLFGLVAGWCNENTSGGMILVVLMWVVARGPLRLLRSHLPLKGEASGEKGRGPLRPCGAPPLRGEARGRRGVVIAGLAGNVTGLALMVLAPGNRLRALNKDEAHTGLMKYTARFLKATKVLYEEYLILICVFAVLLLWLYIVKKQLDAVKSAGIWGVAFLATAYALCAAPDPQTRAFFGAGIFLITGIGEAFCAACEDTAYKDFFKTAVATVMAIVFAFIYIDCGANLARVKRDVTKRYDIISDAAAAGEETVYLPLLHEGFDNRYTMAYRSDLSTDWDYWVNYAYVEYFGVEQVIGVERDEWDNFEEVTR